MKITAWEYTKGVKLDDLIAEIGDFSHLTKAIDAANKRLKKSLNINRDVLQISGSELKILGIAGAFKLTPRVQINVVPKFIDFSSSDGWMKTLFLLSSLSKFGNILTSDQVASATSYIDSLYQVAARVLAEEFDKNSHKPIRQYSRERLADFGIDAEIEFDSLFEKKAEGIEQTRNKFDKRNPYNGIIKQAMEILLPYSAENRTRAILKNGILILGPQDKPLTRKPSLNSRYQEWQKAFDLAFDVVKGMGANFDLGNITTAGFVVDTWRLWEWLLTVAITIGKKEKFVAKQQGATLGKSITGSSSSTIKVFPDITVYNAVTDLVPSFLVDAKYKNALTGSSFTIDPSDLHEAIAFCIATHCNLIYLAYPKEPSHFEKSGDISVGPTNIVSESKIIGIAVAFGSLSEKGGIYSFAKNLSDSFDKL